jgi:hypothetical protein
VRYFDNAKYRKGIMNTIYYNNNMNPLSRIEKETKYTSKLLPTGNLPIPRNSWVIEESTNLQCVNSAAGMRTISYTIRG